MHRTRCSGLGVCIRLETLRIVLNGASRAAVFVV